VLRIGYKLESRAEHNLSKSDMIFRRKSNFKTVVIKGQLKQLEKLLADLDFFEEPTLYRLAVNNLQFIYKGIVL
jgi:hypothetical protein